MLLVALLACSGGPAPDGAQLDPAARTPEPAAMSPATEDRYAASHVLIAYDGAARSTARRSESEAKTRAIEIWQRLVGGEPLDELARRYSDGPSAPRGGSLGVYRPGTMMPEFEQAVAAVREGQYTRPFHTAFGWHVARRDPVVEARARHILVSWRGAVRSGQTRTKAAARAIIEQAEARLEAGERFEVVATEVGEDATAPRGGDLGVVAPGQLVPAFETALFELQAGQRSAIVETQYGFHLIERIR